jgi:hypothetical protein
MTRKEIKDVFLTSTTKKFKILNLSKLKGDNLFDILQSFSQSENWCFDVFCKKPDFCLGGLSTDINKDNYKKYLQRYKKEIISDIISFYSDITNSLYYRVILNFNTIEDLRNDRK